MDNDRIDFSTLDPKRDPRHFERMVQVVVVGALAPVPPSLLRELVASGRAAVVVAILLAFAAWLPSLLRGSPSATTGPTTPGSDPVELVFGWAQMGEVPADVDVVHGLRGTYER